MSNIIEAPVLFLKYHPMHYLKEIQEGNLYFNTIQKMADLDIGDGRGDPYEYVTKIQVGPGALIDFASGDNNVRMIRLNDGNYRCEHSNTDFYANIFCFYSLQHTVFNSEAPVFIPEKLRVMGDHVLVISQPAEFIQRLLNAIPERQYQMNYVDYIDIRGFDGRKSYFQKDIKYQYQNEFRFMIRHDREEVQRINIGSIEDISQIVPSEKLKSIKFKIRKR